MDTDVQFGEIALQHELVNRKQHDEAWRLLRKLRRGKGRATRARLVDVMVQKEFLTGTQARQVENARLYRETRRTDKLYGRIAIKSQFCEPEHVEKGLSRQKSRYLKGKKPVPLSEFLVDKGWLSEEHDRAIREALAKLNVVEYMEGRQGSRSGSASGASGSAVSGSGSEVDLGSDEDGSEDELSGVEIDLDIDDDAAESLDDLDAVDALDSNIDDDLSGLDLDLDLDSDDGSSGRSGSAGSESEEAPVGLSSEAIVDELDFDSEFGEDSGSGIDIESVDLDDLE